MKKQPSFYNFPCNAAGDVEYSFEATNTKTGEELECHATIRQFEGHLNKIVMLKGGMAAITLTEMNDSFVKFLLVQCNGCTEHFLNYLSHAAIRAVDMKELKATTDEVFIRENNKNERVIHLEFTLEEIERIAKLDKFYEEV